MPSSPEAKSASVSSVSSAPPVSCMLVWCVCVKSCRPCIYSHDTSIHHKPINQQPIPPLPVPVGRRYTALPAAAAST